MWQKIIQMIVNAFVVAIGEKIVAPLYNLMKDELELRKKKKESQQAAKDVANAKDDQSTIDSANRLP